MTQHTKVIKKVKGLGDINATFKVYMGNQPTFDFCHQAEAIAPLEPSEIYACGQHCGNGWRKVFNVYAKLVFALAKPHLLKPPSLCSDYQANSWQAYRDHILLQAHSNTALMFSAPAIDFAKKNVHNKTDCLHLIMGKTYAKSLNLPQDITWINSEFAVHTGYNMIVCPYFDYRQLSNAKILFLNDVIEGLF